MGTSTNQRSPRTPNWRAVEKTYTHPTSSPGRTTQEIWRAASNEVDGGLFNELGSPIVAKCLEVTQSSGTSAEAAQKIRRLLALSGQSSLAGEIAQRAAVITHEIKGDKTDVFVRSLFSEASNYLVSRDLPGFVGLAKKVATVNDAVELKKSIINEVSQRIDKVPKPPGKLSNSKTWKSFVNTVVDQLSRTG